MKDLCIHVVLLFSGFIAACGGVPMKVEGTPAQAVAEAGKDTCPPAWDRDAVVKHGYPKEWRREYREPPSAWGLYTCSRLQPLIEWAKGAGRHESERGGCRGGHTSFTCESRRGPSGASRQGREWRSEGTYLALAAALRTMPACEGAASVRRHLRVSVGRNGGWRFEARAKCYQ